MALGRGLSKLLCVTEDDFKSFYEAEISRKDSTIKFLRDKIGKITEENRRIIKENYELRVNNAYGFDWDATDCVERKSKPNKKPKTYILKDKNTGLYKIGKSTSPLKRERTLQGEKPTYELIKIFDNNIEKELHKMYDEQRVRGEWFKLTKIQVRYICTHF